ncbi:DNA topoisomerase 2 [Coemansia sp. RSA 475]|nr:DNA topoisomerase 2 [Coemansia sp. RSA 475]
MAAAESTGLDKHFKLTSTIPTTNMVCFDREGRLRRFQSAEEIIDDFYPLRLRYYQLRKENMAEKLGRDLQMADNRARFVMEIIQKKLTVNNRKRLEIIQELRDRGYAAMAKPKPNEADADAEPASDYDYLLSMPIWNLTMEKVEKLLKEKRDIEIKLEELLALTPIDLWNVDLDEVERMWNTMVDEYEERLADDEVNRKGQGAGRGKGKTVKRVVKRKPDVKSEVKPLGEPVPKVRKVGAGSVSKASVTPKQSVVTTPTAVQTPTAVPTPATMGSDLDDSDEDVATMIFKKAAMKKQGAVKQTTLGSMLAQKAESGVVKPSVKPVVKPVVKTAAKPVAVTKSAAVTKPATAAKPAAKPAAKRGPRKAISDSEDDDDGFVESDSDDLAPPPPRQTAGRRAAATKTPVYMDVSDDSDDGDFK